MKKDSISMNSNSKMNMSSTGSNYNISEHESQRMQDLHAYKNIKDSIDKITKGLQSK